MDRVAAQLLAAISSHGPRSRTSCGPPFESARRAGRPAPPRTTSIAPATGSWTTRAISGAWPARTTSFTSSITATPSWSGTCPPGRTVVTCHDLDAFRSIFERRRGAAVGAVPGRDALHPRRTAASGGRGLRHRGGRATSCFVRRSSQPERVCGRSRRRRRGVHDRSEPGPADSSLARILPVFPRPAGRAARRRTMSRKRIDVLLRCFAGVQSTSRRRNWCASADPSPPRRGAGAAARHRRPRDAPVVAGRSHAGRALSARRARRAAVGSRRLRLAGDRSAAVRHAGRRQRSPGAA